MQVVRISAVGLAFAFLAGCGGDRFDNRVEVTGQVKQKGQPLAAGSIIFVPKSGSGGPGAEGKIVGGLYKIEQSVGPTPGPHRVMIATTRETPKVGPPDKAKKTKAPKRASGAWGIEVDVPAGETFTKDFELR